MRVIAPVPRLYECRCHSGFQVGGAADEQRSMEAAPPPWREIPPGVVQMSFRPCALFSMTLCSRVTYLVQRLLRRARAAKGRSAVEAGHARPCLRADFGGLITADANRILPLPARSRAGRARSCDRGLVLTAESSHALFAERNDDLEAPRYAACGLRSSFRNVTLPSFDGSTVTLSPSWYWPARICKASGFSTIRCSARLIGLAPKTGS